MPLGVRSANRIQHETLGIPYSSLEEHDLAFEEETIDGWIEKPIPPPRKAKPAILAIPLEYKTDVVDAVDNWLKSYKSHHNDKTIRQRKRMLSILATLEEKGE